MIQVDVYHEKYTVIITLNITIIITIVINVFSHNTKTVQYDLCHD